MSGNDSKNSKRRKQGGPSKSPQDFAKQRDPIPLDPLTRALRRSPMTLEEMAQKWGSTKGGALDAVQALQSKGLNIHELGGAWTIPKHAVPAPTDRWKWSAKDGIYRFGLIADTHYGSVHCREEVVEELYDWYAAEGIERVYHCGNWIDGEHRFNKYELVDEGHGTQAQINYFVKRYPQRKGITTYYVAGDDHEGWAFQREGIDVGRLLQHTAEQEGRKDLVYLGYKEAFITLEHPETKKHARMLIDHPGGGSAYALSYAAQKRVEASQPGEKPAIWCFGHWHKCGVFLIRGVHCILVPCTKDLDTFGRKKGLEYHIGGLIVEAEQDPGGAILSLTPKIRMWLDRGYHNAQFSPDCPTSL